MNPPPQAQSVREYKELWARTESDPELPPTLFLYKGGKPLLMALAKSDDVFDLLKIARVFKKSHNPDTIAIVSECYMIECPMETSPEEVDEIIEELGDNARRVVNINTCLPNGHILISMPYQLDGEHVIWDDDLQVTDEVGGALIEMLEEINNTSPLEDNQYLSIMAKLCNLSPEEAKKLRELSAVKFAEENGFLVETLGEPAKCKSTSTSSPGTPPAEPSTN